MSITIKNVPDAPENYDLDGKVLMIHDLTKPDSEDTKNFPAINLALRSLYRSELVLTADGTYAMKGGEVITNIIIDTDIACTIKIGSATGLEDILRSTEVPADGDWFPITTLIPAKAPKTLYISGIPANGTVSFIFIKNSI